MKGKKKFLSLLLSFLLTMSVFNTSVFTFVKAEENGSVKASSDEISNVLKNINSEETKRLLAQKFGSSGDDGTIKPGSINELKPTDSVRIIVELEGLSLNEQMSTQNSKLLLNDMKKIRENIKAKQKEAINKTSIYGNIRHSFQDVLNGFSAEVKLKDIENIKKISGVKKVTIANVYYPDINSAVKITNAPAVWNNPEFGLKGEGMVVAIIDTGIDYTHKDMKLTDASKAKLNKDNVLLAMDEGKFFTDKVPYGYNFADRNQEVRDLTDSMHGMHVSGITAANGDDSEVEKNLEVKGVAPEAQLLAMKVFSNDPENGGAFTDDLVAAIDSSVKHHADVINMSLGSTAGFVNADDPEQKAIKNAVEGGTAVVVSAGNSGYSSYSGSPYSIDPDLGLVGAPGIATESIQVASLLNLSSMKYSNDTTEGYAGFVGSEVMPSLVLKDSYELVDCGIGAPSDFEGKDMSGKIALMQRGTLNFVVKKQNAQAAGAAGAIVYNNASGGEAYVSMATDSSIKIPCIFMKRSDGEKLKSLIASNIRVSFVFDTTKASLDYPMSDFSSWGSTPNLDIKPEVTAPGGNIYSTLNNDSYGTMSGTSMAAPHVSGAAALVAQSLIKNKAADQQTKKLVEITKMLLVNTAEPLIDSSTKLPYLVRNQGSGLIKIDRAIKSRVYAQVDGMPTAALREVSGSKSFTIKLTNFGKEPVTLNAADKFGVLTNLTARGMISTKAAVVSGASLSFDKQSVTIDGNGGTEQITVTLNLPGEPQNIFVEGFVSLTSESNPTLTVPYMGFFGKWDEPRVMDDPLWYGDSSYYGLTCLTDIKGNYLGQKYAPDSESVTVDENNIAFSPKSDSSEDFAAVLPNVTFLRNAKTFKVEILKANENPKLTADGEDNFTVLRQVSVDNNVRKNYMDAYTSNHVYPVYSKEKWAWDGKLYNAATGEMELAPDGQYYIRLSAVIDYEGAQYSNIVIPVKLDTTAPKLEVTSMSVPEEPNKYKLKWNCEDESGIFDYAVVNNGKVITWLAPEVSEYDLTLSEGINRVQIAAFDNAQNMTIKDVLVDNNVIKFNEHTFYTNKNDITIDYDLNEGMMDYIGKVEVVVDDQAPSDNGIKESITISNLAEGQHKAVFNVYAKSDNSLIATDTINIYVDKTPPTASIKNLSGAYVKVKELPVSGTLTEDVKKAEISTVKGDIVTAGTISIDHSALTFTANVTFPEEGLQLIKLRLEDFAGNVNEFGIKVCVDTTAPEMTISGDNFDSDKNQVVLAKDQSEYTFNIKIKDTLGYRLYVNGEQIGFEESSDMLGVEKTYDAKVNVPKGNSIVVIRAVDLAGNETEERKITMYRAGDSEKPVIEITTPADNDSIVGLLVNVSGKVTDETAVTLTINDQEAAVDKDGNFSKDISFEDYGEKTIEVKAVDESGNEQIVKRVINLVEKKPKAIKIMPDMPKLQKDWKVTFKAWMMYEGTSEIENISDKAEWTASKGSIENGVFTPPQENGPVTITASYNGFTCETQTQIEDKVEPYIISSGISGLDSQIICGETYSFKAFLYYVDGTKKDITSDEKTSWKAALGTIDKGEYKAPDKPGQEKIEFTYDGLFGGSMLFSVMENRILYLKFDPPTMTMNAGETSNFKLYAVYLNKDCQEVTDKAEWTASEGTIDKGRFTAPSGKDCVVSIKAKYSGLTFGITVNVKVPAPVYTGPVSYSPYATSLKLVQDGTTVTAGKELAIKAQLQYSDGTSKDVTEAAEWTADKGTITKGKYTAPADYTGNVNISAKYSGFEAKAVIEVKAAEVKKEEPVIVKLQLSLDKSTVMVGEKVKVKVNAAYSDGSSAPVSDAVVVISNKTKGMIQDGLFRGIALGSTKLYAEYKGIKSNELSVSVCKQLKVSAKGGLAVRSSASSRGRRLGLLKNGTKIIVTGYTNGWYQIVYNGKVGYVSARYVK